jgi:putative flippase GtrA
MDFAIYAAFVGQGGSVYWGNIVAFCAGTVFNVMMIRAFVFPDSRFRLTTDLQLTLLMNGLVFWLGMAILWILIELVTMSHLTAKLLANGLTLIANYVTRTMFFGKR